MNLDKTDEDDMEALEGNVKGTVINGTHTHTHLFIYISMVPISSGYNYYQINTS